MNITEDAKGLEALLKASEDAEKRMSVTNHLTYKEEPSCTLDEGCLSCGA